MTRRQNFALTSRARRRGMSIAAFAFVLVASACTGNSVEQGASDAVETAVVDNDVEQLESVEVATIGNEQSGAAVEVPATTTTTEAPAATTTTTTTEPTDGTCLDDAPQVIVDEPGVRQVRVNSGGVTVSVNAEPGSCDDEVGTLTSVTWYVEATGKVVGIGNARYREVVLLTGQTGWVPDELVQPTNQDCTDVTIGDIYETADWEANLDGDGLTDTVTYIRANNGDSYLRVEFGNGAVTAEDIGNIDIGLPSQGWVTAEDINGDGYDEILYGLEIGRSQGTSFFSMDGCSFTAHESNFARFTAQGVVVSWACKDFGTSSVQVFETEYTADENGGSVVTGTGYTFDPTTGFTATGETVEMSEAAANEFFDELCSNDYS